MGINVGISGQCPAFKRQRASASRLSIFYKIFQNCECFRLVFRHISDLQQCLLKMLLYPLRRVPTLASFLDTPLLGAVHKTSAVREGGGLSSLEYCGQGGGFSDADSRTFWWKKTSARNRKVQFFAILCRHLLLTPLYYEMLFIFVHNLLAYLVCRDA